VYVLECAGGGYYTGYTRDLEARLDLHRRGRGSAYVAAHLPFKLVYRESLSTQREAMLREIEIKTWPRRRKAALIAQGSPGPTRAAGRRVRPPSGLK